MVPVKQAEEGHLYTVEAELARGANLSIISVVNGLIEQAHLLRASDIHIDPKHKDVRVRLRVDGVLQEAYTFPKSIHSEVVSRIKVLANLRTDEHQASQDGRFRYMLKGDTQDFIDMRVSVAPTYHGENVVMRLLSDNSQQFTLADLGFSESDRKKVIQAVKKPTGMILSTGPTGSGKTTTLYTLIKMLNTKDISIITIEDPIEYAIEDISQIQINPRTGLTFSHGLRSILRQDPNIIMVGEIRDAETAGIAVNTALTGHLLLSTLHTNDAATTLPRLLDMGIDPYLVASTVNIAIGQRLVRKICEHCKEECALTEAERESLTETLSKRAAEVKTFYRGKGCASCNDSGFKGRVGINEVLVVDNEIREAILSKSSAAKIKEIAVKNGMTTMFEDGFSKAIEGQTTISEILRIVNE